MSESKTKTQRDSKESLLNQEITVTIEKMAITGEGVARHNSAVVFVPWSAPGDQLRVLVDFAKKNHFRAKILEILKPGPSRIKAPCEYAGRCGGCTWQHLSRTEQLEQKQSLTQEVFSRFLPKTEFVINKIIESPKDFEYRNRIQPRLRDSQLGFYGWKTHDWVPVKDCLIAEAPLRKLLTSGQIQTQLSSKKLKADTKIELYLSTEGSAASRIIEDDVEDQLFSQVNRFQNEDLVKSVVNWSLKHKPRSILDLYCGSGNFTFPLSNAHKSAQVLGVELNADLVVQARKKSEDLKIPSKFIEFYSTSVDHFMKKQIPADTDLVILDPPRAGTSEFILKSFAASGLKHIIYISCHPVSLARDLSFLKTELEIRNKKLSILEVQPFEMFPQTNHVETLIELRIDSL